MYITFLEKKTLPAAQEKLDMASVSYYHCVNHISEENKEANTACSTKTKNRLLLPHNIKTPEKCLIKMAHSY
jgi:hypothetical protein